MMYIMQKCKKMQLQVLELGFIETIGDQSYEPALACTLCLTGCACWEVFSSRRRFVHRIVAKTLGPHDTKKTAGWQITAGSRSALAEGWLGPCLWSVGGRFLTSLV